MESWTIASANGLERRAIEISRRMVSFPFESGLREHVFERAWMALDDDIHRVGVVEAFLSLHLANHRDARNSLMSVLRVVARDQPFARESDELFQLAEAQHQWHAAAMFFIGPPSQEMSEEAAQRADAKASSETLGHLKTQARLTTDLKRIAQLSTIYNPSVVSCLLSNSHLSESLVLAMASRRPTRPAALWEIWKSPKWSVRSNVLRALAFNPYAPPALVLKTLPLLGQVNWRELTSQKSLHPMVRRYSASLLNGPVLELEGEARDD